MPVPYIEMAADYWERNLNVDVDIQVKERAVWQTMMKSRTYKQAAINMAATGGPPRFNFYMIVGPIKWMRYDDPYPDDLYAKIQLTVDETERNKLWKELEYYTLENVFYIGIVSPPPFYRVAQPWLMGWHGEVYYRQFDQGNVNAHLWLDLDMKKAMTGRK